MWCLLWLCLVAMAPAAEQVTYKTPPRCEVWLEGEDCADHNWIEGPIDNCWAFGAAGIHGGVLDLAHWRLPDAGRYNAPFSDVCVCSAGRPDRRAGADASNR